MLGKIPVNLDLLFMTDIKRVPEYEKVIKSLPKKSIVIFRDYDYPDRINLAKEIRNICRSCKIRFFFAIANTNDTRYISLLKPDGLHFPEARIDHLSKIVKKIKKVNWLYSCSAHDKKSLIKLSNYKYIDMVIYSKIFFSSGYNEKQSYLGINKFFANIRNQNSHYNIFALGGISDGNIKKIAKLNNYGKNLTGVAVTSMYNTKLT